MDYYSYIAESTPRLQDSFIRRLTRNPIEEIKKLPKQTVDSAFSNVNQAGTWYYENFTLIGNEKAANTFFDIVDSSLQTITGPQFVASELPPPTPQQDNTILYAGIGVAALGLVYYLQTKK
jgi:hypothetical protein